MFESPRHFVKDHKRDFSSAATLTTVHDPDDLSMLALPHKLSEDEMDSIPRIDHDTLLRVLDGEFDDQFDETMVIDCRFEYEFEGGHIAGARNYNDKEALINKLFDPTCCKKTLLILHCEYSVHRAPTMAKHIRQGDRSVNDFRYPALTYPDIYVLDGGYHSFYKTHPMRCFPQNYVEMSAKEHEFACERGMGKLKQQRIKLNRAQTFAFGQHATCSMEDSPTSSLSRTNSSFAMSRNTSLVHDPRRPGVRTTSY